MEHELLEEGGPDATLCAAVYHWVSFNAAVAHLSDLSDHQLVTTTLVGVCKAQQVSEPWHLRHLPYHLTCICLSPM